MPCELPLPDDEGVGVAVGIGVGVGVTPGGSMVMVVDLVSEPREPEHVRVYVVVMAGLSVTEPEMALAPDQPPDELQMEALADDQVMVEDCPWEMEPGLAERLRETKEAGVGVGVEIGVGVLIGVGVGVGPLEDGVGVGAGDVYIERKSSADQPSVPVS